MRLPSPPPDAASSAADPRIAAVQRAIDARAGAGQLQAIHPYGARRPEQCLGLIDWSFVNQTHLAYQRIPTYYEWYLNADQRPVYEHHKRFLQHLQFRSPGDWVRNGPSTCSAWTRCSRSTPTPASSGPTAIRARSSRQA